ncbi:hypothetical protein ACPPVO_22950 [Dactylosporangium sp. McL0621]|uniref:pectate lyase family protein n=1 Tax=Dactylosporangium sp. McL0621 TaxID=3415678 RepID=UPI003CE9B82C
MPTYGYEIPVTSNKTIIGAGKSGRIKNGGFFLGAGVHNVIICNLTIGDTAVASDDPDDKDFDYDGIQMDKADHVWIDHDTFTNINDGYIDSRKDTSYLTVSWNVMGNHNKTFGIGWTDNVTARATIHHNWIHDTTQRNPRRRQPRLRALVQQLPAEHHQLRQLLPRLDQDGAGEQLPRPRQQPVLPGQHRAAEAEREHPRELHRQERHVRLGVRPARLLPSMRPPTYRTSSRRTRARRPTSADKGITPMNCWPRARRLPRRE